MVETVCQTLRGLVIEQQQGIPFIISVWIPSFMINLRTLLIMVFALLVLPAMGGDMLGRAELAITWLSVIQFILAAFYGYTYVKLCSN